jgi:hypothetical protein
LPSGAADLPVAGPAPRRFCANHPETLAPLTCRRCGDFVCADCIRHVPEVGQSYCVTCHELRERHLTEEKLGASARNHAAGAALVLGLLSFIPMAWPCWLGGIILGIRGLIEARRRQGQGRRLAVAGLTLTLAGMALTVVMFTLVP